MLPQEKHLKEAQALDCWSTHHILHLILSLPAGINSQAWCRGVNASEAWVKQDSCLCLSNHLPAKSEPWPSKEEKSSIILIPWFGAYQVILWVILGFLISKMGSRTYPVQQVIWGSGIFGQNAWVGGLVGHLPGHPAPFPTSSKPRSSPLGDRLCPQISLILGRYPSQFWLREGKIPFCS